MEQINRVTKTYRLSPETIERLDYIVNSIEVLTGLKVTKTELVEKAIFELYKDVKKRRIGY